MGVVCVCVYMYVYTRDRDRERWRWRGEGERIRENTAGKGCQGGFQLAVSRGICALALKPSLASGQLSECQSGFSKAQKGKPEPEGETDVAEVKLSFWLDLNE